MSANPNSYDTDVIAWANEQARLLRAGQFEALDIEHIADEIEDVGKSEKRELRSRMAVLLAHLLKWQYQPDLRERHGGSWRRTIKIQRSEIEDCLTDTPSLKADLGQPQWWRRVWNEGVGIAVKETGLDCFPESCPWAFDQIMSPDFWPES